MSAHHRHLGLAFAGLALATAGCSQGVISTGVRAFNRPGTFAFVCLERATGEPLPLASCVRSTDDTNRDDDTVALHALVTQEARGEIAAVDLVARRVLDTDPRLPGFSFVPVHGTPSALAVGEVAPRCAFVAARASHTVEPIDLHRFRVESFGTGDDFDELTFDGEPTALAVSPDERTLFVALGETGTIARVPIGDDGCTLGSPEIITLSSALPTPVTAQPPDLVRVCPADFAVAPSAPAVARDLMVAGEPDAVSLAISADQGVVYVADGRLPLLHRVSLDGTVLDSFDVGATLSEISVTPPVPDEYASGAPTSTFVYGIDAADGTVLAVDVTDGRPSTGAVVVVDATSSTRPDRIPFASPARMLRVITPGLEISGALCDPSAALPGGTPAPGTLRGVFLAVGLGDGSVRFVDIYDLDAPCRGRAYGGAVGEDCTSPSTAGDAFVYVRRHRPRAGIVTSNIGASVTTATFGVAGSSLAIGNDGSDSATATPNLAAIDCPEGLSQLFPRTADPARICGMSDPFAVVAETWTAVWEGPFYGVSGTAGNFEVDGDIAHFDARLDFCTAGVLGAEDAAAVPAELPESRLPGDVLVITTPVRTEKLEGEPGRRCAAVVGVSASTDAQEPITIPFRSAEVRSAAIPTPYIGRLELALDEPLLDRDQFDGATLTLRDVLACFDDELVTFEIHARGSFLVRGARSGSAHRVVANATTGRCEIDASLPVVRQLRAVPGRTFQTEDVAFQLDSAPTLATTLTFAIGNVPTQLGYDAGSCGTGTSRTTAIPADVRYSPISSRLYLLDASRRGLVEYESGVASICYE